MSIDKIETVRTLLKYTGNDNNQRDAVIRGAITILQSELSEVGTVGTEKTEAKPKTKPSMGDETKVKQAKPKQKRKPFDTGKMKACLNSGRSVAWVADEMGVSTATIYTHMKKEGLAVGRETD